MTLCSRLAIAFERNQRLAPHYQLLSLFVTMTASEFWETLDRLGLSQYHDGLVQEAFDSWDVLADITEKDLYVADHLH